MSHRSTERPPSALPQRRAPDGRRRWSNAALGLLVFLGGNALGLAHQAAPPPTARPQPQAERLTHDLVVLTTRA